MAGETVDRATAALLPLNSACRTPGIINADGGAVIISAVKVSLSDVLTGAVQFHSLGLRRSLRSYCIGIASDLSPGWVIDVAMRLEFFATCPIHTAFIGAQMGFAT